MNRTNKQQLKAVKNDSIWAFENFKRHWEHVDINGVGVVKINNVYIVDFKRINKVLKHVRGTKV